ncbi:putative bifunctional diguanylate cyclase/phosphodiesterase [Pseudomonas sp. NPDC098747]|uniref:putative bifunctional diguanylate cyclase/phosphodiesterase n=1 Tax=Pseudomonas sp. NPDC098747 TaxID=3364487 RepID=UPI00383AABEA
MSTEPTDDAKLLRIKAEQMAGSAHIDDRQAVLLHELQVHQIELEMQNEDLRAAYTALEASRDSYQDLYEHAPVGYLTLAASGVIRAVNLTGTELLGQVRERLLGRRFSARIATQDRERWQQVFMRVYRDHAHHECHLTLVRADGSHWYARLDCIQPDTADRSMRITLTDLSARQKVEARLVLAASVFTHAREGIMITDPAGNLIEVNDAFSTITGYCRADVIGKNPRILASGMTEPALYSELWRSLRKSQHWQGQMWNRRRNGEIFSAQQTITAILDSEGVVQNYVSLFTDVTERHEHQRQLEYIAHYDPLTHLPNRTLFAQRMQQAMSVALLQGRKVAIAYLDLDGFKIVNDALGHETGDRVLSTIAQRMKQALREGCTLSRLGGDEFVVIIIGLEQICDCVPTLERLLAAVAEPMQLNSEYIQISTSIGVSYFPQEGEVGADQLLRQADQAMYQAKLEGKNRFHFFDAQHDLDLRGHNARLDRLDHAIRDNELVLHYQPKVNMRTGEVVGFEALVRWQHPEQGLVAPDLFLPLIEGNQLSEAIGDWVIECVLMQIEAWLSVGLRIPVSVNVGARQLQQPDFVSNLIKRLNIHPQVLPSLLMIEILETSALEDIEGVSGTIRACAAMGVRFALDDFGTGYSSLAYLKRLRVAQLKIDRSFVQAMLDDPENDSILQAILSLASAFKHEAIAEGVETAAQGARLLQLGCELGQGFGIAQPMPAEAVVDWMAQWQPGCLWQEPKGTQSVNNFD